MRTIEGHPGDLMKRIYVSTMTNEKGQRGFASFFEAVLTTKEGSALWHCSAGKDRTGIAAALLLHVLGASPDDIMEDYLASNRFLESHTQEIMDALAAHHLADRLDESVRVLNSVRPDFLQAAMDAACSVSGNLDAYLEQVLHVTPEKQETLRARYLA